MKTHPQIIFGLSGLEITPYEKRFFLKSKPIGFILFSRNIKDKTQLLNLTKSLKKLLPEVKIFVDQEGGRVARIKPPIISKLYPTGEHFAKIYTQDSDQANSEIYKNFSDLMMELKQFEIDSACAPVCDIYYKDANNVIGDRSYGDNPAQVIALASYAIKAIQDKKNIAFIKHIPGHGRATVDSHYHLPIVNTDLQALEATDFKVFKELAKIPDVWAMTAHIVYEALDKKNTATLSSKVIKYIREEIGFNGVLVTDDICMKALHAKLKNKQNSGNYKKLFNINLGRIAKKSLKAGCNVVLHCSGNLSEMKTVYMKLKK